MYTWIRPWSTMNIFMSWFDLNGRISKYRRNISLKDNQLQISTIQKFDFLRSILPSSHNACDGFSIGLSEKNFFVKYWSKGNRSKAWFIKICVDWLSSECISLPSTVCILADMCYYLFFWKCQIINITAPILFFFK